MIYSVHLTGVFVRYAKKLLMLLSEVVVSIIWLEL
jgi:hypothetical protein